MRTVSSVWVLLSCALSGCSTEFWYDQAQFAHYDKCENLSSQVLQQASPASGLGELKRCSTKA